jgi:hypothetical protein
MQLSRAGKAVRVAGIALLGIVIVVAATLLIPSTRHWLLRSAGRALVAEDTPAKADIIVISNDSQSAGILEADDLVHAGYASRVAIFDRPVIKAARELARRGASPVNQTTTSLQLLHELGIDAVKVLPPVAGTVDEGRVLRQWCAEHSIHSVLFVSLPDHSRRTRRVLNRALGQQGVEVSVRYTRFSEFDPDSWWSSRGGQRVQAIETEKLLADYLLHPF